MAAAAAPVVADKESEVILPPRTALNPVPALPAALRIDNREQLTALLQASSVGRQMLIFATESLRTLLLRQVLSDPNTRSFKGKKNWDKQDCFPLPRNLHIASTHVLNSMPLTMTGGSESSNPFDNNNPFDDVYQEEEDVSYVTFFLKPSNLSHTIKVARKIQGWKNRVHFRIVYLPNASAMCRKILSNIGVSNAPNVTVHGLQLDLFPLETDVLSMEYEDATKETEVEGAPSPVVTTVARTLLKIQDVVGLIPRVQGIGPLAEDVVQKFMATRLEEHTIDPDATDPSESGEVTAMVVLDRKVDMVTPMLTPLTYEGLLDDVVGIDCGFLYTDVKVINPEDEESEDIALGVLGSDTLYQEVRDQHVEKFGSFLQNQAKALQASHANFTNKDKKHDLTEIHQFVKQIPLFSKNLRSLTNHILLAELVKATTEGAAFRERWQAERSILEGEQGYEYVDELVANEFDPIQVLKVLCLQSLCAGGIKAARFDAVRRDLVQTYGYEMMFLLNNLEKAGMLRRRDWMDTTTPFTNLRKSLILINAEVNPVEPDDASYVSSGYAPLSVRLLQTAAKGWKGKDEIIKDLPGNIVDIEQIYPPQDFKTATKKRPAKSLGAIVAAQAGPKKPTMIVVYIGGVTYMEIAALRFISKRPSFPYNILVVTTKVLNGASLIKSVV